jgi:hypothetical protein
MKWIKFFHRYSRVVISILRFFSEMKFYYNQIVVQENLSFHQEFISSCLLSG